MLLELSWLIVVGASVVPFGLYILYMKRIVKKRPWNIRIDFSYEPYVSLIIPTYEEEAAIKRKLDNVAEVVYPREKIEIIIVDSASKDKTVLVAKKWAEEHPEFKTNIICQAERKGMVNALNEGLKNMQGDVFVKTDADCLWLGDSLKNALKYLADPQVGSVAGLHIIQANRETMPVKTERTYREFYKVLRIGESKLYSTVLYEGELMLVKREILEKIGFDEEIGGDDVPTALRVVEQGYRAISAEDAYFVEQTPHTWKEKFRQKTRRGRHVFQALWKYKYLNFKKKTAFHRLILPLEWFIYVINPLITIPLTILSAAMVIRYPWLLLFSVFLLICRVRQIFVTFFVNNWIMILAMAMEAAGREKATWQKIGEIREPMVSDELDTSGVSK
jgi:cellulose synthase/poly-beta-1,6-N-acetylglucosamine synthase-like glycosyltransferase